MKMTDKTTGRLLSADKVREVARASVKAKPKMKTEHAGKPIAFPAVRNLAQILELVGEHTEVPCGDVRVSSYTYIHGQDYNRPRSVEMVPRVQLEEFIAANMLPIEGDAVYFDIVDWGDEALVSVNYNTILGGRYLAIVESSTIPGREIPIADGPGELL